MKNKSNNNNILKFNSPLDETNYYDPCVLIEKAKGTYLWAKGDEIPYIDLLMGYSSTNFGHANDKILSIVEKAIEKYDNIPSFNSIDKIELSQKLIDLLPFSKDKLIYYPVGGTKAVDAAIKLARAYTRKSTVISFNGGFHGYSFVGISVTDNHFVEKDQFSINSDTKNFNYPNRRNKTSKKDADQILNEIENYLKLHGKEVAAIIFEPIQGAAGFIIPPDNFLIKLVDIAKKYGIITICDEIQTGVCRTGSFYYINQVKIDPDIVLLGKSLAGGYYPLSAVIANREFFEAVNHDRPGFDSTFANNLLAFNIANNVLKYIINDSILETVQATRKVFLEHFKKLEKFSFIRDIDSVGMAFSYRVQSPLNKQKTNAQLAKLIRKDAYSNHLIIQTAGIYGDYMKLSPSFLITKEEINEAFKRLESSMSNIAKQL